MNNSENNYFVTELLSSIDINVCGFSYSTSETRTWKIIALIIHWNKSRNSDGLHVPVNK